MSQLERIREAAKKVSPFLIPVESPSEDHVSDDDKDGYPLRVKICPPREHIPSLRLNMPSSENPAPELEMEKSPNYNWKLDLHHPQQIRLREHFGQDLHAPTGPASWFYLESPHSMAIDGCIKKARERLSEKRATGRQLDYAVWGGPFE